MDNSEKTQFLSLLMDDTRSERRRQLLQDMNDYFSLIFSDTEESDVESEGNLMGKIEAYSDEDYKSIDMEPEQVIKRSNSFDPFEGCSDEDHKPNNLQLKQEVKLEKLEACSDEDYESTYMEPGQDVKCENSLETSEACSDEDSKSNDKAAEQQIQWNNLMEKIDAFSDKDFNSHMRLQRSTVEYLISKYSQSTLVPRTSHGGRHRMGCRKEVYAYIWYIGNTITFTELGNLFGITKSSAWNAVRRISWWLISVSHEYVKWPQGAAALKSWRKFEQSKKMPGVIGTIGCSHICIKTPKANKKDYYNRKQEYSLILQAVVDFDKKFIDITCGEPGSLDNSRVLQRSDLYTRVLDNYEDMFPNEAFILGDSAYPATKWLVPPFMNYETLSDRQRRFNYIHSATRKVVDDAFVMLKSRFRRLYQFTEQSNLCALTNLIVSACVLHNICITRGDIHHDIVPEEKEVGDIAENVIPNDFPIADTTANRRKLLFEHLKNANII